MARDDRAGGFASAPTLAALVKLGGKRHLLSAGGVLGVGRSSRGVGLAAVRADVIFDEGGTVRVA